MAGLGDGFQGHVSRPLERPLVEPMAPRLRAEVRVAVSDEYAICTGAAVLWRYLSNNILGSDAD
jgi:hypothetical protein